MRPVKHHSKKSGEATSDASKQYLTVITAATNHWNLRSGLIQDYQPDFSDGDEEMVKSMLPANSSVSDATATQIHSTFCEAMSPLPKLTDTSMQIIPSGRVVLDSLPPNRPQPESWVYANGGDLPKDFSTKPKTANLKGRTAFFRNISREYLNKSTPTHGVLTKDTLNNLEITPHQKPINGRLQPSPTKSTGRNAVVRSTEEPRLGRAPSLSKKPLIPVRPAPSIPQRATPSKPQRAALPKPQRTPPSIPRKPVGIRKPVYDTAAYEVYRPTLSAVVQGQDSLATLTRGEARLPPPPNVEKPRSSWFKRVYQGAKTALLKCQ